MDFDWAMYFACLLEVCARSFPAEEVSSIIKTKKQKKTNIRDAGSNVMNIFFDKQWNTKVIIRKFDKKMSSNFTVPPNQSE